MLIACGCLAAPQLSVCHAADQAEEATLINTLQSASASAEAKDDACARLELIGTERSVAALAGLLTNAQFSHSARYALESMPTAKAGKALIEALPMTSGLLQVGIINSLAVRGESAAVPALGKLLSGSDETVEVASAEALGRIGGPKAVKMLQADIAKSTNPLHDAEVDGILTCANHLLDAGKQGEALKLFRGLYTTEKPDRVRVAAFRGVILASGRQGAALATDAIANGDAASQAAALLVVGQLKGAETTKVLAELLGRTNLPVQLALVECLAQRGDPAALPAVVKQTSSDDPNLRLAAIKALSRLGDDSVAQLLAEKAATGVDAERKVARQALVDLNRGPVTSRMVGLLKTVSPEIGSELILALGGRGDQAAVPGLLDLAQNGNETERGAAMQAAGTLADATQIPRFVQMVVDARTEQARSDAADALNSVYQRVQVPEGKMDLDGLLKALQGGSTETRLALLPICSGLAHERVRAALRAAQADGDAKIRDAAVHALCETRDGELLPDLLKLARDRDAGSARELALRGCVRLTTEEEGVKIPNAKRLEALKSILDTASDAGDKRLVLSGVGAVADEAALVMAVQMLNDETVKPEAEQAVIKIAVAVAGPRPGKAKTALKKVLAMSPDETTRKAAQTALNKIK